MSTIQLDFNLPERFELEYQRRRRRPAAAGHDPPRAVRLDRAVLRRPHRALRRRVPGLAGAGAGRRHPGHATTHVPYLDGRRGGAEARSGIRVEVDASDDRMQKKIRTAQQQKVPFMLIAGDRRREQPGAVSFRYRDGRATQRRRRRGGGRGRRPSRRRTRRRRPPTRDRTRARPVRITPGVAGRLRGDCGRRTGWPTSVARASRRRRWRRRNARSAGPRRCPDEDGLIVARGAARLRGAQPVSRTTRAIPDVGAVSARRRLHRPDRRRGRARSPSITQHAQCGCCAPCSGAARLQHRAEPGHQWRAPGSPRTCTSTWCRGGAATPTSCPWWPTPAYCRSCCPRRGGCSLTDGRPA